MSISFRLGTASVAVLVFALAGCANHSAPPASPSGAQDAEVTVDNCGTTVTFEAPPRRVLSIKSTSTEMLLALGLGGSVIGTAFSDGPVSDEWAAEADVLNVVDPRLPGPEATLALEPDLIYAGWESNITADGVGDRATLASLGVQTYVSPSACRAVEYQRVPLAFEHVFSDIAEMGHIFDVSERATALISGQRSRLTAISPDPRGLTALWYSSGSDSPFVGGGTGAPQMIMEAAGVRNIFDEIRDSWSSANWETVVEADPDVIILIDSAWGSIEKKIGVLEANPATAQLSAVLNRRYITIPFPASEPGVRNVEAVETLVEQLRELPLP